MVSTSQGMSSCPQELWEKIIAVSSCKNVIRRASTYFHKLASWSNRDRLIDYSPYYLTKDNFITILFEQTQKGNHKQMEHLLQYAQKKLGKNPTTILDERNNTLWHYAETDAMQKLLAVYGDKPTDLKLNDSVLMLALGQQNIDMVSKAILLMKSALNKYEQEKQIREAAYFAISQGYTLGLKALIPDIAPQDRIFVLCKAIRACQVACVELLLEEKFPVNEKVRKNIKKDGIEGVQYYSPLFLAASQGNLYLTELLLKYGADPFQNLEMNYFPLDHAYAHSHTEIINMLEHAMHTQKPEGQEVTIAKFMNAISKGDVIYVREILQKDPKILTVGIGAGRKKGLFNYAVSQGNSQVIACFIDAGVDVNESDGLGILPIIDAVVHGGVEACAFLHKHGARLDCKAGGWSLLRMAVYGKRLPVVKYLHAQGLDLTEIIADGNSLLHTAAMAEDAGDIIDYLVTHGVPINQQNKNNRTPLGVACAHNLLNNVKKLLACNADLKLGNPIYYAVKHGHSNIVACLLDYGVAITDELVECAHQNEKYDIERLLKERRAVHTKIDQE